MVQTPSCYDTSMLLDMVKVISQYPGQSLLSALKKAGILEEKWKKLRSGKRKFTVDSINELSDINNVPNIDWQRMMILARHRDPLEAEIPVARIKWAFRCLRDDPEVTGHLPQNLKSLNCPLAIQSYFVMLYQEIAGASLLRERETDAIKKWLFEKLGVSYSDKCALTEEINLLCSRAYPASVDSARREDIRRSLEKFKGLQGRPWTRDDTWAGDNFIQYFSDPYTEEDLEDERVEFFSDALDQRHENDMD